MKEACSAYVTRDHSLYGRPHRFRPITPEEAKTHPQRSVITRAPWQRPFDASPDIYEMNVSAGDRLLLCSNGPSGMVDDPSCWKASWPA